MRNLRWSIVGTLACTVPTACADPCLDDGLGQSRCPQNTGASETEGATDSNTDTTPSTATMGTATMGTMTQGMSGSQTSGPTDSDTADGTATMGETETGGSLWCVDADGDGFGDPDDCQMSDEPVDGSVPNGDDCDDSNPETFPGAAPNDDPDACMQDEDGDDWGDDEPPPGVDPGTDCADDLPDAYPGAAEEEPRLCAEDEDDDGWGDNAPPPGVDPGTDCADDNENAYPGAAELEDPPDLCAEDEDDDGWGDLDPPPGVEPGNDCDDTNADAFPGAAPNEMPSDLCTIDVDGDGWGDANPGGGGGGGPGPQSGSDCYDSNPDLNPDTLQLTAIQPFFLPGDTMPVPRTIETIDPTDASLTPFITLQGGMGASLDELVVVTATLDETGAITANDRTSRQLWSIDYSGGACMMAEGTATPIGTSYDTDPMSNLNPEDIICGLESVGGVLYGISHANELLEFDPITGQIIAAIPIMGANINSCGMAYDCTLDRLLVANGLDDSVYSLDVATGNATFLRGLGPELGMLGVNWPGPTGLEYDPVTRRVFLSVGADLLDVDLDPMAPAPTALLGSYGELVSNLQYLPICI